MIFKWIGALLVIAGCGSMGYRIAANQRREEFTLRQLTATLDYVECELQYRLTSLPELCRQASVESTGILQKVFLSLAIELEDQISPDVESCMNAALSKYNDIPLRSRECLELLGRSLGRFDIEGQLKGLDAVRQECRLRLSSLTENKEARLRSYQTLGLCAGAAIVILFI